MNERSWTWLDGLELSEAEMDRRTPAINDLASRWNQLHNEQEQRGFRRQAAYENGEYDEPDFDTDEEREAHDLRLQVAREEEDETIARLERKMRDLGARMMRPYEHWNEDEQLMAYLEGESV